MIAISTSDIIISGDILGEDKLTDHYNKISEPLWCFQSNITDNCRGVN